MIQTLNLQLIKSIQHLNLKDEVNQWSPILDTGQTLAASKVIM